MTTRMTTGTTPARARTRARGPVRAAALGALIGGLLVAGAAGATSALAAAPADTSTAPVTAPAVGADAAAGNDGADGDGAIDIQSSRRFLIHNFTSHRVQLASIEGDKRFEGAPAVGSIIEPGGDAIVEVTYVYGSTQRDDFTYNVLNDTAPQFNLGTVKAHLVLDSSIWGPPTQSTSCSVTDAVLPGNGGLCTNNSTSVTMLDQKDTTIRLAADSPRAGAVLARFYGAGTPATTSFTPTSQVTGAWGDRHLVGTPVFNNTDRPSNWAEYRADEKQTVGTNIAVGGDAEAQLNQAVKLAVRASYGYTWTDTVARGHTEHVEFDPYTKNWVEVTEPVIRYTGDFTIKLGNTTWTITGARFEVPDPARVPSYAIMSRAMTDQERADLAPTVQAVSEEPA